jgi:hypothetical protein
MDAQPVQQAVDGRDQPSPAGGDARDVPDTGGFSLDAFSRDDRLRLFSFTTADHRADYLWILRAFERSRANYVVLLHAQDVAAILGEFAAEQPEREQIPQLSADELTPLPIAPSPWDPGLAVAMAERGQAVMEERLIPALLADLADARSADRRRESLGAGHERR